MKNYNVTLEIIVLDTIYDVEAENEKEAIEQAKLETNYVDGDINVYEIEEVEKNPNKI